MIVHWYLDNATNICTWTFEAPGGRFRVRQPIPEFFKLVESLHEVCEKMKQNIKDGMDSDEAIRDVQQMFEERVNKKDGGI